MRRLVNVVRNPHPHLREAATSGSVRGCRSRRIGLTTTQGEAMALTRGDKMIILGAVALAATVVLGLAVLKRPHLF